MNASVALDTKMRALSNAQADVNATIRELSDGRIRYYRAEKPSSTPGPTRGASFVTEYNSKTGQVRTWCMNVMIMLVILTEYTLK